MTYFCCDERRRGALGPASFNGIDYVEVSGRDLLVFFVNDRKVGTLGPENFAIDGGDRIRGLRVTAVAPEPGDTHVLRVTASELGDFSRYTLRLVAGDTLAAPPAGFDPALSSVDFSFRIDCPSDFDCRTSHDCPPAPLDEPELDYLAKDYASFRRLMLDRLAMLMPQWRDRGAADLEIALVELLAYVGDSLSYRQDAVATEAYLGTARLRTSVRRHARLVDYFVHEGCNARTWVHVTVAGAGVRISAGTPLLTRVARQPARLSPDSDDYRHALDGDPLFFEVVLDTLLFEAHNTLQFYTWSNERCCLPKGATRATLLDDPAPAKRLRLCAGDVLVFEEEFGPTTGQPGDADPSHRHAVRLTRVSPSAIKTFREGRETARTAGKTLLDPVTAAAIVEIEWEPADRLPFALCLDEVTGPGGKARASSRVLGNIVLADHGRTIDGERLGPVPPATLVDKARGGATRCDAAIPFMRPPRFRPSLQQRPLTHAAPYEGTTPASQALLPNPAAALPAIRLESRRNEQPVHWKAKRDLLGSRPDEPHFVAEIETSGRAVLRFGDDRHARSGEPGTELVATYRIGNGPDGNIGAHAIAHVVTDESGILAVTNPLPAAGGTEPESLESVRLRAPQAFRSQQRAVTEADYAAMAGQRPDVQRAAATFRWTGSWHTAFVTVDRLGGGEVDPVFERDLRRYLERFRMAGYDLEVDGPRPVPIELEMHVCVRPDYFRAHVRAELVELFSSRILADGRRGLFHPDNFTFGQPVFLSPLYAAAQGVDGVASVHLTTFQRQDVSDPTPLLDGKLPLGRLEIAMLDNDPSFPDRGLFRLTVGGGK